MICDKIAKKYEFVISTEEMSQIFKCVEHKYEDEIRKLKSDLEVYKRQISNLIKEKDMT